MFPQKEGVTESSRGEGAVGLELNEIYLEEGLSLPWVSRFFSLQETTREENTGLEMECLKAAIFTFPNQEAFSRIVFGDHWASNGHHILLLSKLLSSAFFLLNVFFLNV